MWGGLAEFSEQYVKKGKPLYAEGYLKTRSWDSGDGTKIYRTEVVVENIILLGPKDDTGEVELESADDTQEEDVPVPPVE